MTTTGGVFVSGFIWAIVLLSSSIALLSMRAQASDADIPYSVMSPDGNRMFLYQGGDEFPCSSGSSLNRSIWRYDIGNLNVNAEQEWYTASPSNNYLSKDPQGGTMCASDGSDGYLQLWARHNQNYLGTGQNYTSTRINTDQMLCVQQGSWVQVRALVPHGNGTWPAIWLLGPDSLEWPETGEIDIMESVGRLPNRTFTTIHFNIGPNATQIGSNTSAPTLNTEFHVYSAIWNASGIYFYTDNVSTFVIPRAEIATWYPFSEDRCFYVILNYAVGGDFGGQNIDNSVFPSNFVIDYVRIYTDNISQVDNLWNRTGWNTPGQSFGLGQCGSATLPQQNWSLASLQLLQFPQFSSYFIDTSLPVLDGCTTAASSLFVEGVGKGYLYALPGGNGYDVTRNRATGILQKSSGGNIYSSAELALYSQGALSTASSCCVYVSYPETHPHPHPTPLATTAAPTESSSLSSGAKIGIGIGVVLALALVALLVIVSRRRARRADEGYNVLAPSGLNQMSTDASSHEV